MKADKELDKALNQRVRDFLIELKEVRKISGVELAEMLGVKSYSDKYISNVKTGSRNPGGKFIIKLAQFFPEVHEFIHGKEELPKTMQEYPKIKPALKEIHSDPNGKNIPFYDTEVFASIEPSLSDTPTMRPAAFISIPLFNQGDAAVQVTGHSMKGYINHGDWIVIKRITNRESIIYGEPHLVITKADNIKTVKFIKQLENRKKLTLIPYNIEQFDPQDISWSDVLEIWRVIGLFRTV